MHICSDPSLRVRGRAEPGSEILVGHQMLSWSRTASICDFMRQQRVQKTDSSSCDGKIFSLCVCSALFFSKLKRSQLFAFMFVNYCIICLGKTCYFIHPEILNVSSLNFYIPRNVSGVVKWLCPNLSLCLSCQSDGSGRRGGEPLQAASRSAPRHICIV